MDADITELRDKFLQRDFDQRDFLVKAEVTTEYARLCGETAKRFLDPDHADFQAPPTYISSLTGGRALPADFPRFGLGMDGGKGVECINPVRPGTVITGKTHIHDIYTKTGRSGRMVFIVTRVEFFDAEGLHLANADSRTVMREKSE